MAIGVGGTMLYTWKFIIETVRMHQEKEKMVIEFVLNIHFEKYLLVTPVNKKALYQI